MTRVDVHGKRLEDYPRPSLAVDTAVLTVPRDGRLSVLLIEAVDEISGRVEHRLPGTFIHEGETLADAVKRSLTEKAGVEGLDPRQLHVFDEPGRDDRGWVISVAHVATVPAHRLPPEVETVPLDELPPLKYDHAKIVAFAVEDLRSTYEESPDPAGLLEGYLAAEPGEPSGAFTLRDLRLIHQAVLGRNLQADTFRRAMSVKLEATSVVRRGARGKPAELFVRKTGRGVRAAER